MRVAVLGCGHMGRIHVEKLAAHVDLVVIDPAGVPEGLPSADEVPQDIDAAIVAVPASEHAQVAIPLLERGVPCLIEKPLASDLRDARRLAAFPKCSVNHQERFNPAVLALPDDLQPRYIRVERLAAPSGRGSDVDVVHDLMIHDLDLLLHLAGGSVTELRAVGVPVITSGIDVAEVWLETSTGCVATLTASRISRGSTRRFRMMDQGRYWSLDLGGGKGSRVRWGEGELQPEPLPIEGGDAIEAVHAAFFAAVRGEGPFPCPAREAAKAVGVADRVAEAIRVRL